MGKFAITYPSGLTTIVERDCDTVEGFLNQYGDRGFDPNFGTKVAVYEEPVNGSVQQPAGEGPGAAPATPEGEAGAAGTGPSEVTP